MRKNCCFAVRVCCCVLLLCTTRSSSSTWYLIWKKSIFQPISISGELRSYTNSLLSPLTVDSWCAIRPTRSVPRTSVAHLAELPFAAAASCAYRVSSTRERTLSSPWDSNNKHNKTAVEISTTILVQSFCLRVFVWCQNPSSCTWSTSFFPSCDHALRPP